jgi:hypothetical protein
MLKSTRQLTQNDKRALTQVMRWKDKNLRDCTKGELIDCIIHVTSQVVLLRSALEEIKGEMVIGFKLGKLVFKIERIKDTKKAIIKSDNGVYPADDKKTS